MADEILLYAAGALEGADAEAVRRHLAGGCPRCAGQLAEAEATLALLPLTLAPQAPPASARQALMGRISPGQARPAVIGRQGPPTPPTTPTTPMPWWAMFAIPSAIAAAVAAGVTIFFAMRIQQNASNNGQTIAALTALVAQQHAQIVELRDDQAAENARTVDWASGPNLKTLVLNGTPNQPPDARGRVFWDASRGQWHFFASGLRAAPAGKTYELWFVTKDGKTKMPAGAFNPTAGGDAALQTDVPPSIAPKLTIAAVTDEPSNTPITSPTGQFQLVGSLP